MAGLRKASVAFSGEGNGKKTCLFEPHGYFTALPQLQAVPFFIASLVGFRPVVNQLSAPPPHSLKQKASSPGQGVSWPHIFASPLETSDTWTVWEVRSLARAQKLDSTSPGTWCSRNVCVKSVINPFSR